MTQCGLSGNAAITLRSRLKVKVVKDMLQRADQQPQAHETQQQEYNGLLARDHAHSETGKVTLQLQVRTGNRATDQEGNVERDHSTTLQPHVNEA